MSIPVPAAPRLRIVAEHADFLIVSKPPGMSFHAEPASGAGGAAGCRPDPEAHGVLGMLREQVDGPLHAVHRLDRMTSGLLLVARSADAARAFGERFAHGGMRKLYLALSDRPPSRKQGWIRGGMRKGRDGSWRLTRAAGDDAPAAVTQFFSFGLGVVVPDRFASGGAAANVTDATGPATATLATAAESAAASAASAAESAAPAEGAARNWRGPLRLFVVQPLTGRTHQIRVALKSLGSPILGDGRYGGTPADRGYLHAWALRFEWEGSRHDYRLAPADGECFVAAPLQERLAAIGDPWALRWPGAALAAAPGTGPADQTWAP